MKKRSRAKNHPPLLRYSYTHETFATRSKSFHDTKGRSSLKRATKSHQNTGEHRNKLCLKRDVFNSLESLFDVKKSLNLCDAYLLAYTFNHYKDQSAKEKSFITHGITKSESFIEILSPESAALNRTDIEQSVLEPVEIENAIESEIQSIIRESNSVQKFQQNKPIHKPQNHLVNMAETEVLEKQEEEELKSEVEDATIDKEITDVVDVTEEKTTVEEKEEGEDIGQREKKDEDESKDEYIDEIKDETSRQEESPTQLTLSDLPEEPVIDENVMAELEAISERNTILRDEIQQLKNEVLELSEKPELTEEDTLVIQEKQNILMSKVAELEQLTRKLQKVLILTDISSTTLAKLFNMEPYIHKLIEVPEEIKRIEDLNDEAEIMDKKKEETEQKIKKEMRDAEPYRKIMERDRFALPQVEYPEDKLPRIIVCGSTEDELPKIVVADSERRGRDKCFEKLTGKLTESLTMQEKLVQENAQLEGGKYKLEEALLEKDTVVENLQRKVCSLQAEMRIVVKENAELSRQLTSLNQLVTSPTCCYTCPGVTSIPPSTSPSLPPCSYINTLQRDDIYCRCKCCLQSQFGADTYSPTTETACASPRLAGGASRTEGRYFLNNDVLENVEMCSRGPVVVKPTLQRGACPAELEDKLATYGNSTKQLEQQLGNMESEVRNMQMELANVQKERQQLEQQRKLLKCTVPCAPCVCGPPPISTCVTPSSGLPITSISPKGPFVSAIPPAKGASICALQQLRDLREQYGRLQDDYKNKLCEVSCMRTDAEKLKQDVRDAKEEKERVEIKIIDLQERLKVIEAEKAKFEGQKEQHVEQEQALMVARQRFREAQDELDELRSLIQDQAAQLEDYRHKYMTAQQLVEEQRRQLDLMEMDNARMNENVTLEIGRVKNQFQEKLVELAPLPDILKQTQIKLQESQQMRLVAERNCEDLSRELLGCKDKIQTLQNQLDVLRAEYQKFQEEKGHEIDRLEEMEKKCSEVRHENEKMKNTLARLEEHETQLQKHIDEKMHENTQLSSMLEQIREDSARQVARTKERCETIRRSMQGQIAEMEKQLAQCRATARAAQRDRDEIRQKMQGQINNLNEAFEHAQGRIRSLQGHVNYLKTSYSNIFIGQGETPANVLPGDTPGTGYDSCDCTY